MTLRLDLTADDLRALMRTARIRPRGGWTDVAAEVLSRAQVRAGGGASAVLPFETALRFARSRDVGRGGWQQQLRAIGATLILDDGYEVTRWPEIACLLRAQARETFGAQPLLGGIVETPTFAQAIFG